MSENVVRISPSAEARTEPPATSDAPPTAPQPRAPFDRKRLRKILLIGIPTVALIAGVGFYMSGGRYISTDNAYVGAQKVLITPEVSGKIANIDVREGQQVKPGDILFTLDAEPYRLAKAQTEAKLASAEAAYNKLKTSYASLKTLNELAQKNVDFKRRDYERKSKLYSSLAGSQSDVDTSGAAVVIAQLQLQFTAQQRDTTLSQLMGDPDLPLDKFPDYVQAKAALADAERNLGQTVVRAPIAGTATQVPNIQLGRFVPAGTPVLSVVDDQNPWIDANPKETDITYLRVGQKVSIDVDSFPDRSFNGTVQSVSPGTGAQFSILPAQNATGNWVKVVQRVPVRIVFNKNDDLALLRSGMSVVVSIDTGHSRWPSLFASAKGVDTGATKP